MKNHVSSLAALSTLLFFFSVFFVGCKKVNKEGNFGIQFKAKYGNQNFSIANEFTETDGTRIKFDKLKFFVSRITLIKTDNSELDLKDVALINFSDANSLALSFKNIQGDFKAIRFGLGLDSLQNETDPLSVSESNPLNNNSGMYWNWLKYIFVMMEGKCDTTAGGVGLLPVGLIYHTGTNSLYRDVLLEKNFSVCCNNELTLPIVLDVQKIFFGVAGNIDFGNENTTQTTDYPQLAIKFTDNFAAAFQAEP